MSMSMHMVHVQSLYCGCVLVQVYRCMGVCACARAWSMRIESAAGLGFGVTAAGLSGWHQSYENQ